MSLAVGERAELVSSSSEDSPSGLGLDLSGEGGEVGGSGREEGGDVGGTDIRVI